MIPLYNIIINGGLDKLKNIKVEDVVQSQACYNGFADVESLTWIRSLFNLLSFVFLHYFYFFYYIALPFSGLQPSVTWLQPYVILQTALTL